MNILILSPHRDDAAFSLGLAIRDWLAAGHRVTILGIFTRSLSAPFSDADTVHPNDLLSYVSAMRRREDAELLKLMPGLHMVDLNLKDAPLRLRCLVGDIYALTPSADDTAVAKIQKALAKLSSERTIDAVLLPLGLGHHVDHLVVRDAALAFFTSHVLALYEDLPDAFECGIDLDTAVTRELTALRQSSTVTESMTPTILKADANGVIQKRRVVSVYASQIDHATIDNISDLAVKFGGERVWCNSAWTAASL